MGMTSQERAKALCPLHCDEHECEPQHCVCFRECVCAEIATAIDAAVEEERDAIIREAHAALWTWADTHADKRHVEQVIEDTIRARSGKQAEQT